MSCLRKKTRQENVFSAARLTLKQKITNPAGRRQNKTEQDSSRKKIPSGRTGAQAMQPTLRKTSLSRKAATQTTYSANLTERLTPESKLIGKNASQQKEYNLNR
jgi:hypothetical protein